MTPADMAALLRELHALEQAAGAIAARSDLAEAYIWRCVTTAIADRRGRLIQHADRLLSETGTSETGSGLAPHALADLPPGRRVH